MAQRPPHGEQYLFVLDRIRQPQQPMDFPDAGDAAAKAGGKVFRGLVGDESGDYFGRGGYGALAFFSAPVLKSRKIGPVTAERVLRVSAFKAC